MAGPTGNAPCDGTRVCVFGTVLGPECCSVQCLRSNDHEIQIASSVYRFEDAITFSIHDCILQFTFNNCPPNMKL